MLLQLPMTVMIVAVAAAVVKMKTIANQCHQLVLLLLRPVVLVEQA
jgi:hypothetical protein